MWRRGLLLLVLAAALGGCSRRAPNGQAAGKRMVVLGIDGMDPAFLEAHWQDLPNLRQLKDEGDYRRLATTTPPQSPVAWSTFITGLDPEGHGIFDFIHRDPSTMSPVSSMAQASTGGRHLTIGSYVLPLTGGEIRNLRRGTPFWETLARHGVNAEILRMPTDFPPIDCEAQSLSGMGTPDLRGTFGTFTFFTDDGQWKESTVSGGDVIRVRVENGHARLLLPGPDNSLRQGQPQTRIPIDVFIDPEINAARFDIDGQSVVLKQGEWSGWLKVRFPLIPVLAGAEGMLRIYAKQLHPRLAVYVSPVNLDPSAPAMPISQPASFSGQLARRIGPFYTQGMPYDTGALRHGVLSRGEYREHSRQVSRQMRDLLMAGLDRFADGVLFFHFFGVDQDSHMLWGEHEEELLETYRFVDAMVGEVRARIGGALLMVLSDHGFAPFRRAVHLNTWLEREGFLATTGADPDPARPLSNVDWSRTKAYAVGLNTVYVNRMYRERDGIVAEGEETREVIDAIRRRLLEFRDPDTGARVVTAVHATADAEGIGEERAPDLIVGYAPPYRASWQTALGEIPRALIEDNRDEWRGDHCMDPGRVPGVLLSNRRIAAANPELKDITVTILEQFGISKPKTLQGRNVYAQAIHQAR